MIVDTNALSAVADGETLAVTAPARASPPLIPVIVLGEFRFGIAQSRYRPDYEAWLKDMIAVTKVLEVNDETAIHYAEIRLELRRIGAPIPSNDLWIAALCRQHECPILSPGYAL